MWERITRRDDRSSAGSHSLDRVAQTEQPPSRRGRWVRRGALTLVLAVAVAGSVVVADGLLDRIDAPAESSRVAQRVTPGSGEVVSVFNVGAIRPEVRTAMSRAAADTGADMALTRSASIGLLRVRRGSNVVQQAPDGARFPLVVSALPVDAARAVLGSEVANVLSTDTVVMGQRTADLRGARAGDRIDVLAADGSVVSMRIALVGTDVQVGGSEVVMSTAAADRLGITRETRILVWGFASRGAIDQALTRHGVANRFGPVRVVRSWDPRNPDSTLSTARAKEALGEFWFRLDAGGSMSIDPAWITANLPPRQILNATIPVNARCHAQIVPALRAALAEVAALDLSTLRESIDVENTNRFGGCFNPRFNRLSGELGFVSRHAWAMALDVNTQTNCQGCVPRLDCQIVQIFRRHGFAWGGNFLVPDGMHFEWVGERRDLLPYPSRYCPNEVPAMLQTALGSVGDSRHLLLADETLTTGHDHAHDHAHEHEHP